MADDFQVNSATTSGAVIAADEVAGVKYQRVKPVTGADGTCNDVCNATPMPVSDAAGALTVDDGGASLTVDGTVTAQTARTVSHIGATLATDGLMNGTTLLTAKRAVISAAAAGANELVAAVAAKKLRVLSLLLVAAGPVAAYFYEQDEAVLGICANATNPITFDNTGAAGPGGLALNFNPVGWFETATANKGLRINLGGAVGISGCLTYVEF